MMFALKRAGEDKNVRFIKSGGYTNTGWARVELSVSFTFSQYFMTIVLILQAM